MTETKSKARFVKLILEEMNQMTTSRAQKIEQILGKSLTLVNEADKLFVENCRNEILKIILNKREILRKKNTQLDHWERLILI